MLKHKFFIGQPIFTQLLNFIPRSIISDAVRQHRADRYCKRFKTYDHLVSMLYVGFHQCTSLREAITGLQAGSNRLRHTGLSTTPRRSTLSDANKRRQSAVFEQIYHQLYQHHYKRLPDSRDNLFIIDSTTITLFSNIIKGAGSFKANGQKKGGVKAHVLLDASHNVASFVRITEGACHDLVFLQGLNIAAGSVVVFDKAYTNYAKFDQWNREQVCWVTRQKTDASYQITHRYAVTAESRQAGVLEDHLIIMGRPSNKRITTMIRSRRIVFKDEQTKKQFVFITNDLKTEPQHIAALYKRRWQIELVFKRIKQRYPLRYFLGDNDNAVRIQIWTALICDLLIQITKDQVESRSKTRWSYANLAGMVKHHLMNYINLITFLINPEKALLTYQLQPRRGLTLF